MNYNVKLVKDWVVLIIVAILAISVTIFVRSSHAQETKADAFGSAGGRVSSANFGTYFIFGLSSPPETINSSNFREIGGFLASFAIQKLLDKWSIAGNIGYYSNNNPVGNTLVKANDLYSDTTDINGDYDLQDLSPDNYIVRPEKESDVGNAIGAFDAAWILQYGVGVRTFEPCQMIAADVSGNGGVSAYDAARILQYGVGLINQFSVMTDSMHFWRFVPEDFVLTMSNWMNAPDSIAYTPLNRDTTDNYVGIIYGDVSGNWLPSAARVASLGKSASGTADIRLEDVVGKPGERFTLPVYADCGADIIAMSFTLEYDPKILTALRVSSTKLTEGYQMAYNVTEGQVKVAFAGIRAIGEPGAVLNLEFEVVETKKPNANSQLNISEITINEGNISVTVQGAEFTIGSPVPEKYALSQNYPNPFNNQTVIKYQLPEAGRVVLKIYNTLGQEIRTLVTQEMEAGYHEIHWDGTDDKGLRVSSGVYIYRLQAKDFIGIKKMLFLQ